MACCTSLNPSSLPRAIRGRRYSQTITPTCDGIVSYTISLFSGTLPPGLTFSQTAGSPATITGLPRRTGNFTFTLQLSSPECESILKTYRIGVFSNKKTGVVPARINCVQVSIGGQLGACCNYVDFFGLGSAYICSFGT